MIKEHSDLDRIEAMIVKGENLELCLRMLTEFKLRLDELTARLLVLHGTPNPGLPSDRETAVEWPAGAKVPKERALNVDHFYFKESVLSFLGYHVGANGAELQVRRSILRYAYLGDLPRVKSPDHMQEWGDPQTSLRLRAIVYTIYRGMENGVKRNGKSNMRFAIQGWKEDLQWLKAKFFDGRHCSSFKWPIY